MGGRAGDSRDTRVVVKVPKVLAVVARAVVLIVFLKHSSQAPAGLVEASLSVLATTCINAQPQSQVSGARRVGMCAQGSVAGNRIPQSQASVRD